MDAFDMEFIGLEEGWEFIQMGITKLKRILEGYPEPKFTAEEYMMMYTTIFRMCTPSPPHNHSNELYFRYKDSLIEYISSAVMPSLREKQDEFMLREFVRRWSIHKDMARWLSHFFNYLDRFFITRWSLLPLNEVGFSCFRDLVYNQIKENLTDAVIALIDQEREGGQIDRTLLKDVLDIFVKIGLGSMNYYKNDFEETMLECTAAYYSRKASDWIVTDSFPVYMLKVEECLKREKDRVSHYLHSSSEPKLLEKVHHGLLFSYAKVLVKESSGCHTYFRDDKVDDLSRMYRLFYRIPHGLDSISQVFRQHVTSEGTTLVKQAEGVASSKKAEDVVVLQEQVFVRKLIEHFDKYIAYVSDCFQNHHLFRKALIEAVEVLCNKVFPGSSSAELLATFCDSLLRKCGNRKLSDEGIEEILEKVVKFLSAASDKDIFVEFYRKKLARRLLFDQSANYDHERSILAKLKHHCGRQFSSKMEGMRKSGKFRGVFKGKSRGKSWNRPVTYCSNNWNLANLQIH